MLTLGIDTSTKTGSIGLLQDEIVSEITLNIEKTHSERLMPALDELLSKSGFSIKDIDLISYSEGPGSFTGLRIALAAVKGIAFSTGCKIAAVSSLEALAMNAVISQIDVCPMIDARKDEIYTAVFRTTSREKLKILIKEQASVPYEFIKKIKRKTLFLGSGARRYKDIIKRKLSSKAIFAPEQFDLTRGINVAILGRDKFQRKSLSDVDSAVPNYLRKSQAELNLKS